MVQAQSWLEPKQEAPTASSYHHTPRGCSPEHREAWAVPSNGMPQPSWAGAAAGISVVTM